MKTWADIILSYTKTKGLHSISLGELYNAQVTQNPKINRRLSMDAILQVCEWMQKNSKIGSEGITVCRAGGFHVGVEGEGVHLLETDIGSGVGNIQMGRR